MTAGFVPPADPPTATTDASQVVADTLCRLSTMGCDEHRNVNGDDCLLLLWYHELGDHIAADLADAGLLMSPLERAVTQAERNVIDTATTETEAENVWRTGGSEPQLRVAHFNLDAARVARRAAVTWLQTARRTT